MVGEMIAASNHISHRSIVVATRRAVKPGAAVPLLVGLLIRLYIIMHDGRRHSLHIRAHPRRATAFEYLRVHTVKNNVE